MGLPARKIEHTKAHKRPYLRLVRSNSRRRSKARRSSAARSREVFTLACVVIAGICLFGIGRVMLAARATEASMRSNELRQEIKDERLVGDLLEVDMSALTVPSRIENIAGNSMHMSEAASVEYMSMPTQTAESDTTTDEQPEVAATESTDAEEPSGLLASLVEMAAGEAHVLLVGDVGLASSE